jgi:hypothetical protein
VIFRYFNRGEGWWILLRFGLLGFCTYAAARGWCPGIAAGASFLLGVDILLFNTAVVFVTGRPLNGLRSNVFTMASYVSLALVFSPFWLLFHDFTNATACTRTLDAIYQSVRTLTTAGPEDALSSGGKILASVESLVGIYFLSIIIAGYLSFLRGGRST